MFYAMDRDMDGYLNREELDKAFMPRETTYQEILVARPGFHGSESKLKSYF
jgi:Ca2+-binding EF-hand superfamily protein